MATSVELVANIVEMAMLGGRQLPFNQSVREGETPVASAVAMTNSHCASKHDLFCRVLLAPHSIDPPIH
jgi:hypothetical protein